MHADRTNRVVLGLLGLVALAAGVAGLLAGAGAFGGGFARRSLLDNGVGRYISQQSAWFWPVVAVAGLVVAVLALRWLAAVLFSTARIADIAVRGDRTAGSTTLAAPALGEAVSSEIATYRGVHSARTRLLGTPGDPRLAVAVRTDQAADLGALRHRIDTQALAHVRQALDRPDLPIGLDVTVTRHRAARVR